MRFCIALVLCLLLGCPAWPAGKPSVYLWAWKRNEDLSTIDPHEFGVAYLACHAFLRNAKAKFEWRQQYLHVPPGTPMIPCLRIDVFDDVPLNPIECEEIVSALNRMASLPNTYEVQIDFDARQNQRAFYKSLIRRATQVLPPGTQISMTALASWCLFDDWISDLPVNESVPMMFSLGRDRAKVLNYLQHNKNFLSERCNRSLGLSIEEPDVCRLMIPIAQQRTMPCRFYFFSRTAWNDKKLDTVRTMLGEK